ncbi:MAG: hypothetical protein VYD87_04450 [Pseudomonadota bacterium]|nr:hypothetical protein [Pseudomonadota bacterium]
MRMLLSEEEFRAEWRRLRAAKGNVMGCIAVADIEVEPGRFVTAIVEVRPAGDPFGTQE